MALVQPKSLKVSTLADQLVADIHQRQLKAGDRYLTAAEASKMLGVGNAAANRALQILERRRLIVRQQRRGAYIADPPGANMKAPFDRVHFLVHKEYLCTEGLEQEEIVLGLEREMPGVTVQFSFLPIDEVDFINELLADSARAKRRDGFVLVRSYYETQRLLADYQMPTVVYGNLYPSIKGIAALSVDMHQVGYLMSEHLVKQGHTRFAYLNRQLVYQGDQLTMNGISSALHAAGIGLDAFGNRFLPPNGDVCLAIAEELLRQPERPTAILCRTAEFAGVVLQAAEKIGLRQGKDFEVAICNTFLRSAQKLRFIWPKPQISPEEQGQHLARMLITQANNEGQEPADFENIPVSVEAPSVA